MNTYKREDGMREISGFGGGYEEACQKMLQAGLEWLDEHPDADPKFSEFANVTGLVQEENEDARTLSNVVGRAVDDCTGAMHHMVLKHCLYIRGNGWDKYVEMMKGAPRDERGKD